MYDTITRMPMIVWAPNRCAGGRKIDGLCQQFDIGPTILELAGVDVPKTLEARSVLPALMGDPWTPREFVYAEHGRDGILQETEFMSMVRSQDWKLVHFVGESDGQLFDLNNDPNEVRNLWHDASFAQTKRGLLDELREWRIRSQIHTSDWSADWR